MPWQGAARQHDGYNGIWPHANRSDEQAHSGRYALMVAGNGRGKVASVAPLGGGPGVIGESAKRYRLTAWVKAELSDGCAFVRVDEARWHWADVQATREAQQVSGRSPWTLVAVELQPGPNDPFLVLRRCVDGVGAAWFEDVLLEELARSRHAIALAATPAAPVAAADGLGQGLPVGPRGLEFQTGSPETVRRDYWRRRGSRRRRWRAPRPCRSRRSRWMPVASFRTFTSRLAKGPLQAIQ